MDATLRTAMVAEARFLRALYYFNLVSLYGNVPLVLQASAARTNAPPGHRGAGVGASHCRPAGRQGRPAGLATPATRTWAAPRVGPPLRCWARPTCKTALGRRAGRNLRKSSAPVTYSLRATTPTTSATPRENNAESIFEVQFYGRQAGRQRRRRRHVVGRLGSAPSSGACPATGFTDGEVRPWVVHRVLEGAHRWRARDPRLAATVFYNRRQFATCAARRCRYAGVTATASQRRSAERPRPQPHLLAQVPYRLLSGLSRTSTRPSTIG